MNYFWGEESCQGITIRSNTPCLNKAYYTYKNKIYCGVHCQHKNRVELPKSPTKPDKTLERRNHQQVCEELALANKNQHLLGEVICYKMRMMKLVPLTEGYVNIFPNVKHGHRTDGIGLPSLSPKMIENIQHDQPFLSPCPTLEIYHKANLVYADDLTETHELSDSFYEKQSQCYHTATTSVRKDDTPVYFVWFDSSHELHLLTPLQGRHLFCMYYEKAVRHHPDFLHLHRMVSNGFNLQICGYSNFNSEEKSIEECYADEQFPFSHELILYTMLTIPEEEWMWKQFSVV